MLFITQKKAETVAVIVVAFESETLATATFSPDLIYTIDQRASLSLADIGLLSGYLNSQCILGLEPKTQLPHSNTRLPGGGTFRSQ
jgi:hypothetical protein